MAEFSYSTWSVKRSAKKRLLDFLLEGLCENGCTILFASDPASAPFFIAFETREGERRAVLVYAFLANSRATKNRPEDEHRFQVKYGSDAHAVLPVECCRSLKTDQQNEVLLAEN